MTDMALDDGAARLTGAGTLSGMRALLPIAFGAVFFFGLAFGITARETGLSLGEAALMSATVFAGASQFAALGQWGDPMPVVSILVAVIGLNGRMVLMGASLRPAFGPLPAWQAYSGLFLMTDPNWAVQLNRAEKGEREFGILVGGGLLMYGIWLLATIAGFELAGGLGDPRQWGVDVVLPSFFGLLLMGFWRGPATLAPWGVALAVSIAAYLYVPGNWYVVLGALAGGIVGALRYQPANGEG